MSVYFIRDERGRVKIGVARNATIRLVSMQTGNADRLTLARIIRGAGAAAERWFHNHYVDRRITGEWFRWCETMLTLSLPSNFVDTKLRPCKRDKTKHKRRANLAQRANRSRRARWEKIPSVFPRKQRTIISLDDKDLTLPPPDVL